jgi:hypothetical protein
MIQTMLTSTYKTIWMSATLPRVEALPTLVSNFLSRYNIPDEKRADHVKECFSTELDRGALMCGPTGAVAFPHQKVTTAAELKKLCERLPGDPLVLKAYTERALASLLERWASLEREARLPSGFDEVVPAPETTFADLSELNHASIRRYAMQLLMCIADFGDDQLVVDFCERRDTAEGVFFPAFDIGEILFSNAHAYPGLTLVAHDDPAGQLLHMAERLMANMPTATVLDADVKAQEAAAMLPRPHVHVTKKNRNKDGDDRSRVQTEREQERSDQVRAIQLRLNPELVIQSQQFLRKYCASKPCVEKRQPPTVEEFHVIKELPVTEKWQMLALAGAAAFDPGLNADAGNPVYTQWVHEQMTLKKLACVTAGKEFTWGANVPASTVVVTKAFGESTSVAGMLQYVGRAARRGLTTHGQAVFEREEDLDRIFASPDGHSTEAETMERFAKWWLSQGGEW